MRRSFRAAIALSLLAAPALAQTYNPGMPQIWHGAASPSPATLTPSGPVDVTVTFDFYRSANQPSCDYAVSWGDGSPQVKSSTGTSQMHGSFSHKYTKTGTYLVSVLGVGASACWGSFMQQLSVQPPPPTKKDLVMSGALGPKVAPSALATAAAVHGVPTAAIGAPTTAFVDVAATFDASGSTSVPPGHALTYKWEFGDGGVATGATASHRYAAVGAYTVKLVVLDGETASAPLTTRVQVVQAGAKKK